MAEVTERRRTDGSGGASDKYDRLLGVMRQRLAGPQFKLWFKDTRVDTWRDGRLVIALPNAFYQDWFQSKFVDSIQSAAESVAGGPVQVSFCVDRSLRDGGGEPSESTSADATPETTNPAPPAAATPPTPSEAPPKAPMPGIGAISTTPPPPTADQGQYLGTVLTLNRNSTFDSFVTGPSNEMAYASARGVVEDPGNTYNPLFIHGAVGLGKTHLLHAICIEFRRRYPDYHVRMLSCAEFTHAFIQALERNQVEAFRDQLRHAHLLIIDDIHFLSNKERTQEEFFNTFNRLHQLRCQIVLSSDAAPADIPALEERLVSRFNWGLVTCLEQPEMETRMAIIRRKAELFDVRLPPDVVEFIASQFRNNIRELEGALQSVRLRAEIENVRIDLDLAGRALAHLIRGPRKAVTMDRIMETVCDHYDVKPSELRSRRRTRNISLPRQVAMFLARKLTELSLQEVGGSFGGRDHTTVLFSVESIERKIKEDEDLARTVRRLLDRLGGPLR